MSEESGDQAISRRERAKNWVASHPVHVFLIISGMLFFLLMVAFPDYFPSWLGLREIKNDSGEIVNAKKTAWDWLELLIVPAMLAGGAAWIAHSQQNREMEEREADREIAEKAREVDREIAEKARDTDREIAKDRQEQVTLENYYDRMAELLLTHDLRSKTDDNDEERSIARARTLTVLRSLNATRKGQVLRFLYESKLVDSPKPTIVLIGADLRGINLSGTDLIGANLNKTNLSEAILSEAILSGTNLYEADLSHGYLYKVWAGSIVMEGSDGIFVEINGADLRRANLRWADLRRANLKEANLIGANLNRANLTRANLTGAKLIAANLTRTNLSAAKYTSKTIWPENFDPKAAGAILVDDDGNRIENLDEEE